ncbi:putative phosphoserine phosphatase [Dorcoceras hygrometricum]|uniref:Putative phosphoserine phosphatase n=1 Tax=Dorcoceras hygrometricum TaxID=472368 RepID=A0A2Z7BJL2_9LAMI|nr:putative phosphoserine phosphatase [Dorcoceras hygrometricum]
MSKKRQAASEAEVAPVIKKKRSTKGKPAAARRISLDKQVEDTTADEEDSVGGTVEKVRHVPVQVASILDDVDMIISQVISESTDLSSNKKDQGDKLVDETDIGDDFDEWLDSSFPVFDSRVDEPVVASTNLEKATSSKQSAEVHMSFDDFLLQIPNDMLLPSITAAKVSMLRLGEFSSFRDKGKAILVEDDQITENPAGEIVALVFCDVEFLVRVRDSAMNAVVDFFASFSLNNMPDMESLKERKGKVDDGVGRDHYSGNSFFRLLSAAHSQSLDDFKAQQQEHNLELVQPTSSPPVIDSTDCSGVRLAHFYSIARSICWVRPVVLINGVWTPLQESGYWRSDCALSLFVDRKRLPASVTAEYFYSEVPLIEPARYWGAAPLLVKIWTWQRVCTEATQFSMSGRLRPASFSSDIVIRNLGVERLLDYFLDDFEHGVNIDYFAEFLSGSSGQSSSAFDSASSSGDTIPDSSPAASPPQESSSSSSDASMHFDSEDFPVHDQEAAHTSAPVDSNVFTNALEDLRSYISQRIHESTYEIRSKVNDVEFNVRGDLLKQQAWLRQTFQDACDVLERQSKQMNDLKKGLMAPVGTIFQDLFDIKKNQRAQEAKLNALDGQVAALRNEQLEFQNRISADLLSLSTKFADIVEYIRGGDAQKGEGGSSSRPPPVRVERRPLPTPQSPRDVAGSSSAVRIPTFPRTTGTFAERVEQARRHILESE